MRAIVAATREAAVHTLTMIVARPWLFLLFTIVQLVSNLLRLWIGAVSDDSMFLFAVGGVVMFVRIFVTQWLHVATARVAQDARTSLRDALRVAPAQALWFHAMVVVSGVTFIIRRLWVDQLAGGFFAPSGIGHLSTLIGLGLGLFVSYLVFLPFIPGYFATLLGGTNATLRWSVEGLRGQLLIALTSLMLLAMPIAIVRRWVFDWLGSATYVMVFNIAALDAALTVLLMAIATAVYLQTYHRALARLGSPERSAPAITR